MLSAGGRAGERRLRGDAAFDRAMDALGPFEPRPRLIAAVSGGPDSMALALMAGAWAEARGGELLAVTVDHGLRPESAAEARSVGERLAAFGIPHRIVTRREPLAAGNLQAAAREARYRLLAEACRQAACLHLLLGHQLEDQGETAAMRAQGGSGVAGLAGMAPVRELPEMRLLRPLLGRRRSELAAWLRRLEVGWIEDPSNRSPDRARGRLRAAMTAPQLAALGREAGDRARDRRRREEALARLLARTVRLHPAGVAQVELAPLLESPLAEAALGRLLATLAGKAWPPRRARLTRLRRRLAEAPPGAVLGGGALIATRRGWWCGREVGRIGDSLWLQPGARGLWDGRFEVVNPGPARVRVAPRPRARAPAERPWPAALDRALPAFFAEDGRALEPDEPSAPLATFRPRRPLAEAGFALVSTIGQLT